MEKFCQNELCENEAVRQVPVWVERSRYQKRALCAACKGAYDWGVQYGRMMPKSRRLWVLSITHRGMVIYGRVLRTRRQATDSLAHYLKTHEGYDGQADMSSISSWLAQYDERMGVDLFPARLEIG